VDAATWIGMAGIIVALGGAAYAAGANRRADRANRLAEEANAIARDALLHARRSAEAAERSTQVAEAQSKAAPRIIGASYARSDSGGRVSCAIGNASAAPATLRELVLVIDQAEPFAEADSYPSRRTVELPAGGSAHARFDVPADDMRRHGDGFPFLLEGVVEDALGARPFAVRYTPT
jgi:hypothetical protein